jgi:hypothetical protein
MKNVLKLILFSFIWIILSSCKESGTSSTSQNSDGSDSVPQTALEQKSVVNKAPQRRLFRTDGGQITGNENIIRVCTPDLVYCWSACISAYLPSSVRWSIFRTPWLLTNKAAAVAISYPDDENLPQRFTYWEGTNMGGVYSFNRSAPAFDGRGLFDLVTTPEGQATAHPNGYRVYYTLGFHNLAGSLQSSKILESLNPPGYFEFKESAFTASSMNFQLMNGASCIKESEIVNFVK